MKHALALRGICKREVIRVDSKPKSQCLQLDISNSRYSNPSRKTLARTRSLTNFRVGSILGISLIRNDVSVICTPGLLHTITVEN
jgi:hypothetical protein